MSKNRDDHNKYQQQIFAREVDDYCLEIPSQIQQRLQRIVDVAGLKKGDRVLDVGTGTSVLIPFFQECGVSDIVGCDLSSTMLDQARLRFPNVIIWCGDIVDLPRSLGLFDAVFFNAMFGNVWDQQKALRTAFDCLRTGGKICISHPLGAGFVAELNRQDPQRVPHELPDSNALQSLAEGLSLEIVEFADEPEFYVALLHKPRPQE